MRPDLRLEIGGSAELRALTPADADALQALVDANRVRLARWFAWVDDATGPEVHAAWLERIAADPRSMDGNGIWADDLVGGCDLHILPRDDLGELTFWLDEGALGRGLATRACQALIDTAFREEELHRIQLRAGVENLRARAVAKRLKMREEGVLRGAGKVGGGLYADLVMYGLVVDDWRLSH